MKKIIALLIALTLLLSSSMAVFAELDYFNYKYSPEFDELFGLFLDENYYKYDETTAIALTLRKLLEDYPILYPYIADSLLKTGDPYAGFYQGDVFAQAQSMIGMGIQIGYARITGPYTYGIKIVDVFKDSAAEGAGIKPGDEIITVNGQSMAGLSYPVCTALLGQTPMNIDMDVRRGEKTIKMTLIKRSMMPSFVMTNRIDAKTALITISTFVDESVIYDYYGALDTFYNDGVENLIIDLRDNGGGEDLVCAYLLDALTSKADVPLFSEIDRDGAVIAEINSTGEGYDFKKLAVLVNGNTASAAEVFAIVARENFGAVLVGQKTVGKGIGQYYHQLTGGDYATITSLEILSGKGTRYNGKGLEPDIKSTATEKTFKHTASTKLNFVNAATVKPGISSEGVRAVQERLYAAGYIEKSAITGKFDATTQSALRVFKTNKLLDADIKLDIATVNALNSYHQVNIKYNVPDTSLELAADWIKKS